MTKDDIDTARLTGTYQILNVQCHTWCILLVIHDKLASKTGLYEWPSPANLTVVFSMGCCKHMEGQK